MVSEPTTVQLLPSRDFDAVKRLPTRSSFTKYGLVPGPPEVCAEMPLVDGRRWYASPLLGLTSMKACFEPGVSASRIITPAFVQAFTF